MNLNLKEFIWMLTSASIALFALWKGGGRTQLVVLLWLVACIGAIVGTIRQWR